MDVQEQFTQVIEAVEAETGIILVPVERGSQERPVQFAKVMIDDRELCLECDGFSIHAFSEDFRSEEKDTVTLGCDGVDIVAVTDFLVRGIRGESPSAGLRMR